jgi:hypothetical protein
MGHDERPTQLERLPEDIVGIESKPKQDDYAPIEIQKEARALEDPEWISKQKKYLRKLDFILMPTISILYFFEYLDRGNIAVRYTPISFRSQKILMHDLRMPDCMDMPVDMKLPTRVSDQERRA